MGKVHSKPLFLGYSLTRSWVTSCAAITFLFDGKLPHFGTFSAKLGSSKLTARLQALSLIFALCIK